MGSVCLSIIIDCLDNCSADHEDPEVWKIAKELLPLIYKITDSEQFTVLFDFVCNSEDTEIGLDEDTGYIKDVDLTEDGRIKLEKRSFFRGVMEVVKDS